MAQRLRPSEGSSSLKNLPDIDDSFQPTSAAKRNISKTKGETLSEKRQPILSRLAGNLLLMQPLKG
jgi:hypothetical protein